MALRRCPRCEGFVPAKVDACPNCSAVVAGRALLSRLGLAGGILGGSALAVTLMACYGMAPCADGGDSCYNPPAGDAGDAAAAPDSASPDSAVNAAGDGAAEAESQDSGASVDAGDAGATDGGDSSEPSDGEADSAG